MKNLIKKLKLKRRTIALLAQFHFFGNPSAKLKIIGVTGTSGKTTTATLLYRTAVALGYQAGLIGTVENLVAGEKMSPDYNAPATTPDPIFLHKLLNKMVGKKCDYVFMEVASHAMAQRRVAGIHFTGGIFTNFSQDHLDYHKDMEDYFRAKKKFFKMLTKSSFALANTDDIRGSQMLSGIQARKFSYGFNGNPDFKAEIRKIDFSGLELIFNNIPIHSKLVGKFNAYNLLSVWSTCKLLGFDMDKVNKILESIEPPRGRLEHFTAPNGVLVIVDYAHKPDALEKIFIPVQDVIEKNKSKTGAKGRIISVFGCGGDRDASKRKIMGKIGATNSDIAIFTSDNPRSEDPVKIIEQMKEDLSPQELQKVKTIENRHEAILEAVKLATKGDIILCMGKGHEDYQEIKGVKHHFDDMEELKSAFGMN